MSVRQLLAAVVAALLLTITTAVPVAVFVDWSNVVIVSKTTATYQAVVNPLLTRFTPIHDAVYQSVKALPTEHIRFQGWFPYPKLVVPELLPPSGLSQCASVAVGYDAQLDCRGPDGDGVIATVEYAAFGNVTGNCDGYITGECHAPNAMEIVRSLCESKSTCNVNANSALFNHSCPRPTDMRLSIQVTCNPPLNNTYYDFTYLNDLMEDFLTATHGHTNIINLSTPPNWLYQQISPTSMYYPADPLMESFGYPKQTGGLLDETAADIGAYYGRLAAHYINGGFYDEYGRYIHSGLYYNITAWEVLNELERVSTPQQYVAIYDSVVQHIWQMADPQHRLQFVGLALSHVSLRHLDYLSYFLNISNHVSSDIPLDWISYHHYAGSGRTDPNQFESFFLGFDDFVTDVRQVEMIRKKLSPTTKTTVDEIGVILDNDNDPQSPMFPSIYWNAVASSYAYVYVQLSLLGIDAVGCSQLMGFPQINESTSEGPRVFAPQYPSVSILDWTNGLGTARYWALQLLIEHTRPGDEMMETAVSNTTLIFAQAYRRNSTQRILIGNKRFNTTTITMKGLAGGVVYVVDEATGESAARKETVFNDAYTLQPFAVAVFVLKSDSVSSTLLQIE